MSTPQFPHAALLIDFDNVTMGIRSDLSKELKNLLSSDFIKGKVAVQRAYADWRRYPQYIVPLAESSVDLIFAPAYGSSKKNATDIRLAIDALELVFTRPEIGTFILLSGDSDFSSLVLKLKEYGKYVVGVGIRESASDLLVQNCDEYYSYSALTGLTKAGDEPATTADDPWELVELAIKQMADNHDVMRSDRLKQVILEMDPNFDEKALGFQKFNRFMQEAAGRGLVSLRKLENGQFEVGLPGVLGAVPPPEEDTQQQGNGRRRSRRGRGRDRDFRGVPARPEAVAAAESEAVSEVAAAPAETAAASEPKAEPPQVRVSAREVAQPERAPIPEVEVSPPSPSPAVVQPPPMAERGARSEDALGSGYTLLRRAVADVVGRSGGVARDSDIKRRMLELQDGWDETSLGFSKFSRFLRQAHDAEVINLRKLENGGYEASLATGRQPEPTEPQERPRGRGRRESGRGAPTGPGPDSTPAPAPAEPRRAVASTPPAPVIEPRPAPTQTSPPKPSAAPAAAAQPPAARASAPAAAAPAAVAPVSAAAAAAPKGGQPPTGLGIGMRRGSRGRMASAAPPPLLEGQAVPSQKLTSAQAAAEPRAPAPAAEPPAAPPAAAAAPVATVPAEPEQASGRRGGRGRQRGGEREQPAPAEPATPAAAETQPGAIRRGGKGSKPAPSGDGAARPGTAKAAAGRGTAAGVSADGGAGAKAAAKPEPAAGPPTLAALGLPTERDAVIAHLRSYEGVGPKSVQSLVDAFGPGGVFEALRGQPDRVREVVSGARGERLLEAWQHDYDRRVRAQARKAAGGSGGRGRRGGRGSKRTTRA